jgi:spermidine synthase
MTFVEAVEEIVEVAAGVAPRPAFSAKSGSRGNIQERDAHGRIAPSDR